MPSKRYAYYYFVKRYMSEERIKGNKTPSFQQLCIELSPIWNVSNL